MASSFCASSSEIQEVNEVDLSGRRFPFGMVGKCTPDRTCARRAVVQFSPQTRRSPGTTKNRGFFQIEQGAAHG
jgi:hypothetical protein